MLKNALTTLLTIVSFSIFAGDYTAELKIENASDKINDGEAYVVTSGGAAPFTYKWSKQSTKLSSNSCAGLTEGSKFTVLITDAEGNSKTLEGKVKVKSFEEGINSAFVPIVGAMSDFLFWDPFSFIGIYDPVVYESNGVDPVLHPNGDKKTKGIPFIVVWLILGAIFFTLRMKFVNIIAFKHALQLVAGKFSDPSVKEDGEVTHFQALTTALSATVGLGNIAGVAVAITLGGPGATFWMIVAGLIGMSSKFVECTLGVKYRRVGENGEISGGPMYYLSEGLKKKKLGGLGKVLAAVFALLCIGGSFGGGNMFQANQAFAQISSTFPVMEDSGVMFGIILAVLVGVVIIGGIKSIAKVTDKIVPFMAILYVSFSLIIIGLNFGNIGSVFLEIFNGAFSAPALKGGVIGVLIVGFQRAAFSNEAGVGSASIAHSASKTNEPVSEGIVALLEPFVDTVVVCTMTALVLIFTGFADGSSGLEGSELTSKAFGSVFPWFSKVLVVAILLFAFSTMISWSYYGLKAWAYLFGGSKISGGIYKIIFCVFVFIGSIMELGAVLDFSDLMILGMAFPNIIGLLIMSKEVKEDLASYLSRVKSGAIKKFK
ncbi:alanine:cation symporter family protein [Vicingaceae bacterium]|nr:alanine:cation symporter family protein [Vicingaceae bacterium]MDC1451309.1 alanine:cation symporter family protein [Vicingaceae bacterium]